MADRYDERLILGYVESDLDESEKGRFERLLREDPRLRNLVAQLLGDRQNLREMPRAPAPDGVMEPVNAHLERHMLLAPKPSPTEQSRWTTGRWIVFSSAAALVLLCITAFLATIKDARQLDQIDLADRVARQPKTQDVAEGANGRGVELSENSEAEASVKTLQLRSRRDLAVAVPAGEAEGPSPERAGPAIADEDRQNHDQLARDLQSDMRTAGVGVDILAETSHGGRGTTRRSDQPIRRLVMTLTLKDPDPSGLRQEILAWTAPRAVKVIARLDGKPQAQLDADALVSRKMQEESLQLELDAKAVEDLVRLVHRLSSSSAVERQSRRFAGRAIRASVDPSRPASQPSERQTTVVVTNQPKLDDGAMLGMGGERTRVRPRAYDAVSDSAENTVELQLRADPASELESIGLVSPDQEVAASETETHGEPIPVLLTVVIVPLDQKPADRHIEPD